MDQTGLGGGGLGTPGNKSHSSFLENHYECWRWLSTGAGGYMSYFASSEADLGASENHGMLLSPVPVLALWGLRSEQLWFPPLIA